MAAVDGEVLRLPEELLSLVFCRLKPRYCCICAAVSTGFRVAADSDATWSSFLPSDLEPVLSRAAGPLEIPPSKKQLFWLLCDHPVLLDAGTVSFALDRESGKKVWMLSARALTIIWSSTPKYWQWIPHRGSRFSECAELLNVCWLEIVGRIRSRVLSPGTTYAAYLVYKIAGHSYGLARPPQETSISVGDLQLSSHSVCLDTSNLFPRPEASFLSSDSEELEEVESAGEEIQEEIVGESQESEEETDEADDVDGEQEAVREVGAVLTPCVRTDGWMEVEIGKFYNGVGDDTEYSMRLFGKGGHWKKGLIVEGIEIRPRS